MSKPSPENAFKSAQWHSCTTEKTPKQPAGNTGAGFQSIAAPSTAAPAEQSFVSPYVSEQKLSEIREADRRLHAPPEPSLEELKQQAYQEGFAKGEADGMKAASAQAQTHVTRMQQILSEITGVWHRIVADYEQQVLDLVCRVSEQVVCAQVDIDCELTKRSILNAFSAVPEPVGVTIEVNPKDYDYIDTIKEDFFEHITALKDVSVTADPSVGPGGCKIKTRSGEVDATLQARLAAIRQCFVDANGDKGRN